MPAIKVILADDHRVVLEGIKAVLEQTAKDIRVVGTALDGNQVLELARRAPADVYVLDVAMPALNGLETAERLLREDPRAKIIMLSMYDDRPTVEKALRLGVKGYLVKESATEEIAQALRAVWRGELFLSPSIADFEPRAAPRRPAGESLTSKEREIIQLIAEGLGNKQIARRLGISDNTVHVHRHNIALKLDIHKQTELVRYAIKAGIVRL